MSAKVYVVDGARTPFLKAKSKPGPFSGGDLAVGCSRPLLARQKFSPTEFDEVIVGAAMPSADEANIGRVVSLRLGCGDKVPACDESWVMLNGMRQSFIEIPRRAEKHQLGARLHAPVQPTLDDAGLHEIGEGRLERYTIR